MRARGLATAVLQKSLRSSPRPTESALRTLETERDGLKALMDAMEAELGGAFGAAVDRIAAGLGFRAPRDLHEMITSAWTAWRALQPL